MFLDLVFPRVTVSDFRLHSHSKKHDRAYKALRLTGPAPFTRFLKELLYSTETEKGRNGNFIDNAIGNSGKFQHKKLWKEIKWVPLLKIRMVNVLLVGDRIFIIFSFNVSVQFFFFSCFIIHIHVVTAAVPPEYRSVDDIHWLSVVLH